MRRLIGLLAWLDGLQHSARYGHWPDWLYLGDQYLGHRACYECMKGKGGRRMRLPPRPRLLVPA